MRRRDCITFLAGATTAWPLVAYAQQRAMPVIGYLHPGSLVGQAVLSLDGFRRGLSEAGYVEGQSLTIEYRWAENHYDRLPALAADLVGRKVDLIAAVGNAALPAKSATSTTPIVFMGVPDPVGTGLVASLTRPGGNLTGFTNLIGELMPKRLELLSELVPRASMIAWLVNANNPPGEGQIRVTQDAAHAKGVQLAILKAGTESEIDAAFTALVELHAGALLVAGDAFLFSRRDQLLALASRHAIPAMYAVRDVAAAGGLISYGIDNTAAWHQAGIYASRILNGVKPAELPVQQPTKFALVVNLKTAQTLGLTVPQSLLARADELIE